MITQADINRFHRIGLLQGEMRELGVPAHVLISLQKWVQNEARRMEEQQEKEMKASK